MDGSKIQVIHLWSNPTWTNLYKPIFQSMFIQFTSDDDFSGGSNPAAGSNSWHGQLEKYPFPGASGKYIEYIIPSGYHPLEGLSVERIDIIIFHSYSARSYDMSSPDEKTGWSSATKMVAVPGSLPNDSLKGNWKKISGWHCGKATFFPPHQPAAFFRGSFEIIPTRIMALDVPHDFKTWHRSEPHPKKHIPQESMS